MSLYKWSQTAASDATADPSINWAEGQSPSSVNDSARAMMAATAKWRDDIGGNLQTAGTSTAYTLTTNQVFDTEAHMNGAMLTFIAHATNGASPTMNVDGLGARAIMVDGSNAVPTGCLIAGSVYQVVFYNSVSQWRLKDFYVKPYETPVGGIVDFVGSSVPNNNWVFPTGQAISRTTYSVLFALIGTTYGTGDGSTTFNVPDLTGRVVAMKESSATRLTTAKSGIDGSTLGSANGLTESVTMAQANLPNVTIGVSGSISVTSTPTNVVTGSVTQPNLQDGSTARVVITAGTGGSSAITSTGSASLTSASINGNVAQTAMNNVQPTIVLNKIMRII